MKFLKVFPSGTGDLLAVVVCEEIECNGATSVSKDLEGRVLSPKRLRSYVEHLMEEFKNENLDVP